MGSGLKKKTRKEPHAFYNPSDKDWDSFYWCVRNNIRISYEPLEQGGNPQNYKVSVSTGENYRQKKLSPNTYNIKEIEEEMWKAMNYYYDKYKKDD